MVLAGRALWVSSSSPCRNSGSCWGRLRHRHWLACLGDADPGKGLGLKHHLLHCSTIQGWGVTGRSPGSGRPEPQLYSSSSLCVTSPEAGPNTHQGSICLHPLGRLVTWVPGTENSNTTSFSKQNRANPRALATDPGSAAWTSEHNHHGFRGGEGGPSQVTPPGLPCFGKTALGTSKDEGRYGLVLTLCKVWPCDCTS